MILPAAKYGNIKGETSGLMGELAFVKFFIKPVGAEQFIMCSALNYAPAAHNKDNIRFANVESLCATIKLVRPCISFAKAS